MSLKQGNLRDWQGAEQSSPGWSTGSKLGTAGHSHSLCVSPARLRCPGCCHPCLASKPAPGMAQLPGAVSESPSQGGFSSHPVLLSPPSPQLCFHGSLLASLQEAAAWIIPWDCLRGHPRVPDSHQDTWAPSEPPADQRMCCQGAQPFLSQQLSFLPLPSL